MIKWLKRFAHNVLGWHWPNETRGSDGCSTTSRCRYCGKRILQDSQGGWFIAAYQGDEDYFGESK